MYKMNKFKNIIITAIAGISVMCLSLPAYAAGFDINQDNDVNVNDVTYLQLHISGKKNPDGSPFINIENKAIFDSVDMNKDGKLDVQDVTALQIYIAGNENA